MVSNRMLIAIIYLHSVVFSKSIDFWNVVTVIRRSILNLLMTLHLNNHYLQCG